MNRVDEALRRARELAEFPVAFDDTDDGPAASAPSPRALDFYPPEQASPSADLAPAPVSESRAADEWQISRPPMRQPDEARLVPAAPAFKVPAFKVALPVSQEYDGKLVTNAATSAFSTEQYQRLAAAVHHLQAEQGLNRLMVSSSVPREGKTLTIVNLAITLSESCQRRVLLIDADLRSPSLHNVFGIANTEGLCEVLHSESGEVWPSQVAQRLWVLPAGTVQGDPLQTLASSRMGNLLDDLGSQFDWILLDAPPATLMAETGLLVRLTRAIVLVIAAGTTPYAVVEKAAAELGRENIVGTVLNRIEQVPAKWSAYYGAAAAGKASKGPRQLAPAPRPATS